MSTSASEVEQIAKQVKLLILDVDGVMTDGMLRIHSDGVVSKSFNIRDGHLLVLMRKWLDFPVALLSGRDDFATSARARDLHIPWVIQGARDKVGCARRLLSLAKCDFHEAAFVGDDINDVPLLEKVGLGCSPANGAPEAREAARYVCRQAGGDGAVREVCELLLKAQGKWNGLLDKMRALSKG
jgi:3-deoxy-D-manno-octulosonate 8-phosphate phosphatase (KDO 8-P phosphatase)